MRWLRKWFPGTDESLREEEKDPVHKEIRAKVAFKYPSSGGTPRKDGENSEHHHRMLPLRNRTYPVSRRNSIPGTFSESEREEHPLRKAREIPSPVYGYGNRTIGEKAVEFELTPFESQVPKSSMEDSIPAVHRGYGRRRESGGGSGEREDLQAGAFRPSQEIPGDGEKENFGKQPEDALRVTEPASSVAGEDRTQGQPVPPQNPCLGESPLPNGMGDGDSVPESQDNGKDGAPENRESGRKDSGDCSIRMTADRPFSQFHPGMQSDSRRPFPQGLDPKISTTLRAAESSKPDSSLMGNCGLPDHRDRENKEPSKTGAISGGSRPSEKTGNLSRGTLPYHVLMWPRDCLQNVQKASGGSSSGIVGKEKIGNSSPKRDLNSLPYSLPPVQLLKPPAFRPENRDWLRSQALIINQTLASFHVNAKVVAASEGPTVTRFEIAPERGVKVNRITNLADDIKLRLAARDIRMEAPIPGKHTVGIEVPNPDPRPVFLREIVENRVFSEAVSPLTVAIGLDISGRPIVSNVKKMPHCLIAGATGSGKSVCIHSFLVSLLYKANPETVNFLLIDPKMVELAMYNDIPHLVCPVITHVKAATRALKWAVDEMDRRYECFASRGVRDIDRFREKGGKMPYIVIVIDELADLMMASPGDVEESICRIAQKARACGIHLLIATQRPSVDVITGLIKANIPTRIAFSVSSSVDSRTILDVSGAERLLGRGDLLFLPNGTSKPFRLQGCYVTDEEIEAVVAHVKKQARPEYYFQEEELLESGEPELEDELFFEACQYAARTGQVSTSSLQRQFRIGYNRAARLVEMMEARGILSEQRAGKPREVLIHEQDLKKIIHSERNHM